MMARGALCLVGLGVVACGDGGAADSGLTVCDNDVTASIPVDGGSDVYYRTNIRVTLLNADTTARLTLADADGNEVAGESRVEGSEVVFDPTALLDQESTYTATLTYECGTEEITFTTSNTGNPLEVDVVGRVYELDLASGTFVEPPGIGRAINTLISTDVSVYFMPSAIDKETIDFIGAAPDPANPGIQDPKEEPFLACDATWTDPYFDGSSESLTITIAGVEATVADLEVSGDFSVDGSRIELERFGGEIDTRELPTDLGDICLLVTQFGVACEACSLDQSSTTCLSLRVENIVMPYLESVQPLVSEATCPE